MKNICFFCGDINRTGGTERITTFIANELCKRNYNVYILSVTNGVEAFFEVRPEVQLSSLHMEGVSSNFSNIAIIKKLHNFIKNSSIDYIIDVDIVLSFYSIPACISTSTTVISWEHFHYFINVGGFMQRIKRTAARKLAARFSKFIITLTEKDKQQYIENLNCKSEIISINNPITIKRDKKKANLESKIVLAVGRLTPQKGFDLLLQSWKKVNKTHPDWVLRIVGSGEEEVMLHNLAQELLVSLSVEFIPKTKNVELYYRNTSIYVMSSRFEGMPLVLLEAKSYGLPVVSFDCDCGPSDIIRNGVDGLLIEKENTEKLAEGLMELMGNREKINYFSEQALEDNRFELDNIVSQWQIILI